MRLCAPTARVPAGIVMTAPPPASVPVATRTLPLLASRTCTDSPFVGAPPTTETDRLIGCVSCDGFGPLSASVVDVVAPEIAMDCAFDVLAATFVLPV